MYLRERHELIRGLISCVITSSRVRALLLRVGYVGVTLLPDAVGLLHFAVCLFICFLIYRFVSLFTYLFVSSFPNLLICFCVCLFIYLFVC